MESRIFCGQTQDFSLSLSPCTVLPFLGIEVKTHNSINLTCVFKSPTDLIRDS